jgi:diguanylate cyclase (GGDEF)-like protein
MPSHAQLIGRFGLRVILPVVAVLVGALATVVVSLNEMADAVNRIEETTTARSVEAALAVTLRRIGDTHRDYAQWDDAVRNLYGDVDKDFVRENYIVSTANPVFFDTVILIDENGREIFGYRNGMAMSLPALPIYQPKAIATLLDGLPRDGTTYAVHTGIISTRFGLAAVAVGPVVPASDEYGPRPERSRFILISRRFDDEAIARLGADYLIDRLHLVNADEVPVPAVPITDPAGTVVGRLAWSPPATGAEAHASVGPVVFGMLALVSLVVIVLAAVAMRSLGEIERREAEARHAATHDGLTGLPNRTALVEEIGRALEDKRGGGRSVAVVYLDLDGFKAVNDAYGHETGDRLLKEVTAAFKPVVGPAVLARIGGDEFAAVVRGENATRLACDLGWRLISAMSQPFDMDGRMIPLGTSVGVSAADAVNPTAEELLRRADVAMYQAKQQGPNRMFVYDPLIDTVRHERIEIAGELRKALTSDGLDVLYQPFVDATSRDIVGVEALLRWTRPLYGAVPPATFVAIAEETGLINELGEWMLKRACADALAWSGLKLSVNVSPAQFRNPGFETLLRRVLDSTGFPAGRLEVEITETYIIVQPELARRAIDGIRSLGVSIALDDFGTGFSSIGYLRNFAFDKLKLDQSLVAGIAVDRRVRRLVEATISVAQALDLEVTAEGVESEAEAKLLQLAGCQFLQGFHFGKACKAEEMTGLLDRRHPLRGVASASA